VGGEREQAEGHLAWLYGFDAWNVPLAETATG